MKILISLFLAFTISSVNVWADNLLSYIEMPVSSQHLLAFSSQGLKFKECSACEVVSLKPNSKVAYYEHNSPVDIKQATELFVSKKHNSISIFYNRKTNIYDKIVFGGFIEVEPIVLHPNAQ